MRQLESAPLTYTSDVVKCTVDKVEGLTSKRGKSCVAEVTYGSQQFTERAKVGADGTATCAPPLAAVALVIRRCSTPSNPPLFISLKSAVAHPPQIRRCSSPSNPPLCISLKPSTSSPGSGGTRSSGSGRTRPRTASCCASRYGKPRRRATTAAGRSGGRLSTPASSPNRSRCFASGRRTRVRFFWLWILIGSVVAWLLRVRALRLRCAWPAFKLKSFAAALSQDAFLQRQDMIAKQC